MFANGLGITRIDCAERLAHNSIRSSINHLHHNHHAYERRSTRYLNFKRPIRESDRRTHHRVVGPTLGSASSYQSTSGAQSTTARRAKSLRPLIRHQTGDDCFSRRAFNSGVRDWRKRLAQHGMRACRRSHYYRQGVPLRRIVVIPSCFTALSILAIDSILLTVQT